jgi:cob(I)alamin adenosyltransferase
MSGTFDEPKRVAINRVYTGKGDRGETQLVGGQNVPKASARIAAYGDVDELNSFVGRARFAAEIQLDELEEYAEWAALAGRSPTSTEEFDPVPAAVREAGLDPRAEFEHLRASLLRVQHQLFNLGSILATLPDDVHPNQPRIRDEDSAWLEAEMDRCNEYLEPLRSFVLPGGGMGSVELHVCRTVSRRVERSACELAAHEDVDSASLIYLNRLSDAFFVWSRWSTFLEGEEETLWAPNSG